MLSAGSLQLLGAQVKRLPPKVICRPQQLDRSQKLVECITAQPADLITVGSMLLSLYPKVP